MNQVLRNRARVRALCSIILALSQVEVLGAADAPSKQPPFDYARGVGMVAARRGGEFCLMIQDGSLKPGDELALVWTPLGNATQPSEIRHSKVNTALKKPCESASATAADVSYLVDGSELKNGKIYFAMARKQANLKIRQGRVEGRLGGSAVAFRACTSMEGIHLNIWTGAARATKKLWHRYYYLGYDVESTCIEADFKE